MRASPQTCSMQISKPLELSSSQAQAPLPTRNRPSTSERHQVSGGLQICPRWRRSTHISLNCPQPQRRSTVKLVRVHLYQNIHVASCLNRSCRCCIMTCACLTSDSWVYCALPCMGRVVSLKSAGASRCHPRVSSVANAGVAIATWILGILNGWDHLHVDFSDDRPSLKTQVDFNNRLRLYDEDLRFDIRRQKPPGIYGLS